MVLNQDRQGRENTARAEQENRQAVSSCCGGPTVSVALLPDSASQCRCATGIGGHQVTGANGSGKVSGFGEMVTPVAGCCEGGMSSGGWSGPGTDVFVFKDKGQAPFGIDSLYGAPLDDVAANHVSNIDNGFGENDFRVPESCPRQNTDETAYSNSTPGFGMNSVSDDVTCLCDQHHAYDNQCQDTTGPGNITRHIDNAVTEGAL